MRISLSLLGLFAAAGPAAAQTCLYRALAYGDQGFGSVIRAAGDIDGDGVGDWIAGIPWDDTLGNDAGAVRLYSGDDGALFRAIYWTEDQALFGRAVDGAGDVDGDGRDDIVCGAPDSELGGKASGAVVVYSGKNADTILQLAGEPDTLFGTSVAGLGDLDGDGRSEFAVGIPWDDTLGQDGGAVRIYSGDGTVLHEILGNPGNNLGRVVACAGDVDGDGTPDLIASAQTDWPQGVDGYVRVWSGATFAVLRTFTPPQLGANTWYGIAAAGAGDVDGDGFDDVIVGAPWSEAAGNDAGEAYVYSGGTGALVHTIQGEVQARLGGAVACAGDVDGDGLDDVIVGATEKENAAGDQVGAAYVVSGADASVLLTVTGWEDKEWVGSAVAGAGDLNGDGLPDFLVGAVDRVEAYSPEPNRVVYCVGAPNSAGAGAHIASEKSTSISAADLALTATGCPSGQFGLFFFGDGETQLPFGDGYLCVVPPLRRLPVVQVDIAGIARQDVWGHGEAEKRIDPGSTWKFQLWYRDPFGPLGSGYNASDAISITFCP